MRVSQVAELKQQGTAGEAPDAALPAALPEALQLGQPLGAVGGSRGRGGGGGPQGLYVSPVSRQLLMHPEIHRILLIIAVPIVGELHTPPVHPSSQSTSCTAIVSRATNGTHSCNDSQSANTGAHVLAYSKAFRKTDRCITKAR